MSIEAMKQALDALGYVMSHGAQVQIAKDILTQAIEQAEQAQPVAWYCKEGLNRGVSLKQESLEWEPLYTAPPQRKPLTDEESDELIRRFARYELLREVEAKLKEKNND